MSADLHLYDECGFDGCLNDHEVFHLNVTYNLSPMLREVGWVWDKEALEGVRAADVGEAVLAAMTQLEADPEHFRAMDPPNGWGSYDDLVVVWRDFVDAVRHFPMAKVHVWL